MPTLDPFAVLETTLGLDARPVRLPAVTVLRTQGRPDAGAGNAVHHTSGLTPDGLDEALADAGRRLSHPDTVARVVALWSEELAAAAAVRGGLRSSSLQLHTLDQPVATPAGWPWRDDLLLDTPGDDRAWHGIQVLHRHAAEGAHDDRARGAADDRLRWWVEGQRQLVALGRARVVRAERFGTPVGTATLIWEPRVEVDDDHAGLAVLTDVIVHPAHRNLGVASTMLGTLLQMHLAAFPLARVAALLPPELTGAATQLGWTAHERLLVLEQHS